MPRLAARTRTMPSSPIRKLTPYAEQARAEGVHIYGLNIGQPDLPTPPEFMAAITARAPETISYSPSEGFLSYRQALASYYEKYNAHVGANDILITTGGSEALSFVFMSCFDPGDEIITPEPFYANYLGFAEQFGVRMVPLTTHLGENFDLPPIEAFERAITPHSKAIMISNPANPTGKLYPPESLTLLREVALKHDLYLIADEVYKEFVYGDAVFQSVLSLRGMENHAIVIDSVSKRWSACGVRIGNLITRNRGVQEMALKFAQARLSPPTLGQIGCEALVNLPESYYASVREEYIARRDLVVDRLNAMPGVSCNRSDGAFYVMPHLPVDDVEAFSKWLLESFRHNNATVMLAPAPGFYLTPGLGRQEARIAYVLEREELTKAMDVLEEALMQYENTLPVVPPFIDHAPLELG